MSWIATLLIVAVTAAGCGFSADTEVRAQARADMSCDHVEGKLVQSDGRRRETEWWVVEGCGRIAYYQCDERSIDSYTCKSLEARDMPGTTQ